MNFRQIVEMEVKSAQKISILPYCVIDLIISPFLMHFINEMAIRDIFLQRFWVIFNCIHSKAALQMQTDIEQQILKKQKVIESSALSDHQNVKLFFCDYIEPKYEFKWIKQKFFTHPLNNDLNVGLEILRTFLSKFFYLNLTVLIINLLITKENVSLAIKFVINYPLTA